MVLYLDRFILFFEGPPGSIDISVDEIKVGMSWQPNTASFHPSLKTSLPSLWFCTNNSWLSKLELPPPADVSCTDLAPPSADAEGRTTLFPFKASDSSDLTLENDPSGGNTFFSLRGRTDYKTSLTWDIPPECAAKDMIYEFSMKFRLPDATTGKVSSGIAVRCQDASGAWFCSSSPAMAVTCLDTDAGDNWVVCRGQLTWKDSQVGAQQLFFRVRTKHMPSSFIHGQVADVSYHACMVRNSSYNYQ